MFVSVEFDSKDPSILLKFDVEMARLGFTHSVWGMNTKDDGTKEPSVTDLAANFYYGAPVAAFTHHNLSDKVYEIVKRLNVAAKWIIIVHTTWTSCYRLDDTKIITPLPENPLGVERSE